VARPLRILLAALALPYPPVTGHRLRTWALVRALAAEGHGLSLVSFAEASEGALDLAPLRAICGALELVPAPTAPAARRTEMLERLRALASPLPYGAWRYRSGAFRERVERELARGDFDLVICDGVYNLQNLSRNLAVPILLNKDDIAHVIIRRYLRLESSRLRRLYGALEARKVRHWERRSCASVRGVLACSDIDRAELLRLAPSAAVFVAPNVVDTDHYVPGDGGEPRTVLFQGGLDWHPNRDGVDFFVTEILPQLRRLEPSALFRVAGRTGPEAFVRRFAGRPGVQFTGTVPDMRAEIARAAVCVVPLRIGSGTRLKILEAGAMGKAIVSTTLGAEGLDLVPDEEIVIADRAQDIAGALHALLRDPARRDRLGRAARLRVEKQYSQPVFAAMLREALAVIAQ